MNTATRFPQEHGVERWRRGENLDAAPLNMITHQDTYITKLGTRFTFGFELQGGNYRIHILDQPSYAGRDENGHSVHVIREDNDRLVCWTGPVPSLGDARIVASLWSDFTERYILTGQPFPSS